MEKHISEVFQTIPDSAELEKVSFKEKIRKIA
jgi:hypothetical protein